MYENVTGLVRAVIEMSSKIQPAPPEEYVPMVKVSSAPSREAGDIPCALRVQPDSSEGLRRMGITAIPDLDPGMS